MSYETAILQPPSELKPEFEDYSELLKTFKRPFRTENYYYQFGELEAVQGWIIHLSIVKWQIKSAFGTILPILNKLNATYKVPQNPSVARSILDGNISYEKVGKIITVYPHTDEYAKAIISVLLPLSSEYKGPRIPTDCNIDGIIYVRYGAHIGFTVQENTGRYVTKIKKPDGSLHDDKQSIPFSLPEWVKWPFAKFSEIRTLSIPPILNDKYKPLELLKADPKGNVVKGIYADGLLKTKDCVIKQGKMNMWCDDNNRDMVARIEWQAHLHKELSKVVNLPNFIDNFQINDDAFIVLEYIKGVSLHNKVSSINNNFRSWRTLPVKDRINIMEMMQAVIENIQSLHNLGYTHRDITPANFMVTDKGTISLIDIELTYHPDRFKGEAPFEFGTIGFTSPQQSAMNQPSPADDVYSIGASFLTILTNLYPKFFDNQPINNIESALDLIVNYPPISKVISECLTHVETDRPTLKEIQQQTRDYIKVLSNGNEPVQKVELEDVEEVRCIVEQAIKGLVQSPTAIRNKAWQTYKQSDTNTEATVLHNTSRLYDGDAGVIYLLSECDRIGIDIAPAREMAEYAINRIYSAKIEEHSAAGLLSGKAGIALAINNYPSSDSNKGKFVNKLFKSITISNSNDLSFGSGLAGIGYSLIQCRANGNPEIYEPTIKLIAEKIYDALNTGNQKKDNQGDENLEFSFTYGKSGLLYLLLESSELINTEQMERIVKQSVESLKRFVKGIIPELRKKAMLSYGQDPILMETITRIGHTLLSANRRYADNDYIELIYSLINLFPPETIHNNLNLDNGLTGYGMLCLNGYATTGDIHILNRASWLAKMFMTLSRKNDDNGIYWPTGNGGLQTASLFTGTGAIIQFLSTYYEMRKSRIIRKML